MESMLHPPGTALQLFKILPEEIRPINLSPGYNEQMDILGDDGYMHGVPHLVIEVLSAGTSKYDKTKKKEFMQRMV